MDKETYDNFLATGDKIIELNEILIKTIAEVKKDIAELNKLGTGIDHDENMKFSTEEIKAIEGMTGSVYETGMSLYSKLLELIGDIGFEKGLIKIQKQ